MADVRVVDPVSFNVIGHALVAIAEEMSLTIVKSAYSSIVREGRDCSTALLNPAGDIVAQSHRIPIQMNSLSLSMRWLAERGRLEALEPDDILITNDPYCHAQHLNDIFIFTPTFAEGTLIGYTGTVIHAVDIGGPAAAINTTAVDIFGEGLRIPSVRVKPPDIDGGLLETLIRANVRAPDALIGDVRAQLAANRLGTRRYLQLIDRYGLPLIRAVERELMDYSERLVRAHIAELPDGEYRAEDWIDFDGLTWGPYRVQVAIRVEGSDLTIDLTGTDAQLRGPANSPLAASVSGVYSFIAAHMLPDSVFTNEGCFRPVRVIVPYGSLLNPKPPAPVLARTSAANRVYSALKLAFSQIRPRGLLAGGQDCPCQFSLSHLGEDGYRVITGSAFGGWGAAYNADGQDALSSHMSNATNLPVEYEESEVDFYRVRSYELIPDSGGRGRFRGGLAQRRTYEILKDGVLFAAYTDRFRSAPWGLFGGEPGRTGRFTVLRNGERISLPPLVSNFPLREGDVLITEMAGGGGYGAPSQRDPELIRRDLEEGRVTSGAERR